MGLRENAKLERRQQIVRAARKLMRDTGDSGFSMRTLAREAGVSIATPYNLFGSKQTIMYAVLDADLESYQSRLAALQVNEMQRLFSAISLATSLYAEEPGFYRAVLFAVYKNGGKEYSTMFSGPRHLFLKKLVKSAQIAGYLRSGTDADALARTIGYVFFSGIMEWVGGLINLTELELRVQYGVGLLLLGAASSEHHMAVMQQVDGLQTQLQQICLQSKKRIRVRFADEWEAVHDDDYSEKINVSLGG